MDSVDKSRTSKNRMDYNEETGEYDENMDPISEDELREWINSSLAWLNFDITLEDVEAGNVDTELAAYALDKLYWTFDLNPDALADPEFSAEDVSAAMDRIEQVLDSIDGRFSKREVQYA